MAVAMQPTIARSCWKTEFWLGRCEGFRVLADGEPIGFVEEVLEDDEGEPIALVVRVGEKFTHLLELPIEAIETFDPACERVFLGPLAAEGIKAYRLPIATEAR